MGNTITHILCALHALTLWVIHVWWAEYSLRNYATVSFPKNLLLIKTKNSLLYSFPSCRAVFCGASCGGLRFSDTSLAIPVFNMFDYSGAAYVHHYRRPVGWHLAEWYTSDADKYILPYKGHCSQAQITNNATTHIQNKLQNASPHFGLCGDNLFNDLFKMFSCNDFSSWLHDYDTNESKLKQARQHHNFTKSKQLSLSKPNYL